jgi:DNA-binding LacI/PurR family transcriptional regulator
MARRITVYDVAQRAGVSIATVSFAFTRPDKVKPETIKNVMAAADALGYVPSASARGLARGRTGAIGLYAYDYVLEPPAEEREAEDVERSARLFPLYADEVQRGVQLECRSRGLALMIGGNRAPDHLPHIIEVAGRVDGLIAFAGALSMPHLEQAAGRIPVVELGGEARVPGARTVLVDNRQGMVDLTRHLIEVHRYERFAYLGELGTPEFRARWDGFSSTLAEAGRSVPQMLPAHPGNDATTAAAVGSLLQAPTLPDAVVCDTDQAAVVAIDALGRAGLSVPRDIAVTGFDGIVAGRLIEPRLTTVRQPMAGVGRAAVRLLAAAVEGVEEPSQGEDLVATFSLGGTCGCS